MKWQDITEIQRQSAAGLIGTIDSGERWIFENGEKDSNFHRFVCNKTFVTECDLGIISAAHYGDDQHISIAFKNDMPDEAEMATAKLLSDTVEATALNTYIWCRNENIKLRKIIEDTFSVSLNYASHEMSVTKKEITSWEIPELPGGYNVCGFEERHHGNYIDLLEKAMAHVSQPGTTPYRDGYEFLKTHFTELGKENRFHALWFGGELAGLCYSDGGEIDHLAVDEQHRRKGLGYYLLYTAVKNAFLYREGNICLYVVDQNPSAFEFYKRCGMGVTGHSARYFIEKANI